MKRKCFIIMPFSSTKTVKKEDWDKIYEDFFIPGWKEVDFDCERTSVKRGSISKDIIEKCFAADLVMADLTDTNPNVMYELGLRHTFKKPSMMIRKKGCDIPFDVHDYMIHEYENTPTGLKNFKNLVKEVVKDLDTNPEKPDNPVWDMIRSGGFMIDYYNQIQNLNKLLALLNELHINKINIEKVCERVKDTENKFLNRDLGIALIGIQTDSLALLNSTRYIIFIDEDLDSLTKLHQSCNFLIRLGQPLCSVSGSIIYPSPNEDNIKPIFEYLDLIKKVIKIIEKRINKMASNK